MKTFIPPLGARCRIPTSMGTGTESNPENAEEDQGKLVPFPTQHQEGETAGASPDRKPFVFVPRPPGT